MTVRRLASAGVVAASLSAGVVGAVAGPGAAMPPVVQGAAPARLLVYAQEWSLWPSRPSVHAGQVIVQLWNRGQDAHDLRIRRLRHGAMAGRAQGAGVTQSGKLTQATWRLTPGAYELYCSMPGHLKRGMHSRITAH